MPIDPSIALAYRPPQVEDPSQVYGRMLSLANMRQEMQQRQQLAPLVYQQQQAATAEAQIRTQQMQQMQRDQQITADALKRAFSPAAAEDSSAPAAASSPAAASAPAFPAFPAASAPGADSGPRNFLTEGLTPDAPATAAVPSMASAPAASTPSAPAPPSRTAPINLMDVYDDALQHGLSPAAYQAGVQGILAHRKALAETNAAELKDNEARHDELVRRLTAFRDNPQQYQQDNWGRFLQQAFTDKLLNPQEYGNIIQTHPQLPDSQALDNYQLHLRSVSGQMKAALNVQQIAGEKARQAEAQSATAKNNADLPAIQATAQEKARANLVTQLVNAPTPQRYNQILTDNKVAPGTYPDAAKMFDVTGKPIPEQMTALNRAAMTPAERATADSTAARNTRLGQHEAALEDIGRERNAIMQNRTGRETTQAHKDYINNLAEEAYIRSGRDDATGQADPAKASYERAIADVQNPNLYNDHAIGDVRGEVADALRAKQQKLLNTQHTTAQTNNTNAKTADQETFDYLMRGKTPATAGGQSKSAPPAQSPPPPTYDRSVTRQSVPNPAPTAHQPATAAPQKMTEAQARTKAQAAGKDADWYVNELRKRNLIQ